MHSTNFGGSAGVDGSESGGGTQAGGSDAGVGGSSVGGSSGSLGGSSATGGAGGARVDSSVDDGMAGLGGASDDGGRGGSAGVSEAGADRVTNDVGPPDVKNDVINEGGSISDVSARDVIEAGREAGDGGPAVDAGNAPCTGLCDNPIVFAPTNPNYNSGALGTMATCHQTTLPFAGLLCGNFAPNRTFSVNGNPIVCDGVGRVPPATRNGGYCLQASAAVTETAAYFATY